MDLVARLNRPPDRFVAGQSIAERRLEVMAAERELQLFLKGRRPASELAATRMAEIMVADRTGAEPMGLAYLADPDGFEGAIRTPLGRLRYRLGRMAAGAFG